jgi:hypothetical protein
MAVRPLNVPQFTVDNSFDFSPLARLGQINQPQNTTLGGLGRVFGATANMPTPAPGSYTPSIGSNVQSWYDFARRPVDQGGLGLSHEQAAGKVANLQAESGPNITPWGVTGDAGTAYGAAQWRGDRFNNLQKFAAARGLDYRDTATQQAFMHHEYLGSPSEGFGGSSERAAYDRLTAAQTPQAAASAVNRYYERSADTTGGRESSAAILARQLSPYGDQ